MAQQPSAGGFHPYEPAEPWGIYNRLITLKLESRTPAMFARSESLDVHASIMRWAQAVLIDETTLFAIARLPFLWGIYDGSYDGTRSSAIRLRVEAADLWGKQSVATKQYFIAASAKMTIGEVQAFYQAIELYGELFSDWEVLPCPDCALALQWPAQSMSD